MTKGDATAQQREAEGRSGVMAAAFAFGIWGLMPLYWKLLGNVPALEIICHRGLWSFIFLLPFVVLTGRMAEVRAALTPRVLPLLACSTAALAVNWFVFIWAVNVGQVLETSLGNFINPLCNMVSGALFFRDRLRPVQMLAVTLAVIGVSVRVFSLGYVPWVALSLAGSFSIYGVLRKIVAVEAVPGLFVETTLFLPVATGALAWFAGQGELAFVHAGTGTVLLLIGAGVGTSVPMALFAYGARHITMTTLGLLHYVVPTCSFLLGIFVFRESFTLAHLLTFACIWAALVIYTVDGVLTFRKTHARK